MTPDTSFAFMIVAFLALVLAALTTGCCVMLWQRQQDLRTALDILNRSWRSVLALPGTAHTLETAMFEDLPDLSAATPSPLADPGHLLAGPPMVPMPGGPITLADWLRHHSKVSWPTAVTAFYTRILDDYDVKGYFPVDQQRITRLKAHFSTVAIQVMHKGVTVGDREMLRTAHQGIRNLRGEPITGSACDKVFGHLVATLVDADVPAAGLKDLGRMLEQADLRTALVNEEQTVAVR